MYAIIRALKISSSYDSIVEAIHEAKRMRGKTIIINSLSEWEIFAFRDGVCIWWHEQEARNVNHRQRLQNRWNALNA